MNQDQTSIALAFGGFIYLTILTLPFIITFVKKRRQVGRVWSGGVTATLHISGKPLSCKHCGHLSFRKREGILVTSWVAFFRFSFWNQSAVCYTCAECSHVEWFVRPKEENIEFKRDPSSE